MRTVRVGLLYGLAALMVLVGGVWAFQGMGYIHGSPMTGSQTWTVTGSILAGLGVALAISVTQQIRRR
jgi:hypothetical protein